MRRFSEVKVDEIVVEDRIRKTFDEESIKDLASSIDRHGILQPLTVEPRSDGSYKLLIGERRYIAAKRAGLNVVPVIIMDEKLKQDETLEARLIENVHREDLDPMDEAEAYQQLVDMDYNVSEVARRVGKPRYYVSKRLSLLRLHPTVREGVRHRTLPPGHARALLRLEPEQQLALAEEIEAKGLSVKQTREKVREILGKRLSWRLIPIRLSLEEFGALERVAPNGDVEALLRETIAKLIQE